ncbi:hypothetical protein AcW1_000522 [Taiwanofungus camphoratus]|nr:hypothetical protein AcW1_000522 [Antrodia cinnamomea]
MVGKFNLGSKSPPSRQPQNSPAVSPPPPYQENGHENTVFTAATTTTTTHVVTTTTHTTTHFFSLPLWRRRGTLAFSTAAPTTSSIDLSADEFGVLKSNANTTVLMRDKDLPPTPYSAEDNAGPSSQVMTAAIRQQCETSEVGMHDAEHPDMGLVSGVSSVPSLLRSPPALGESTSQSTVALARAALGIGLPHVIPKSFSASSSTSDVNTLTLIPPPPPIPSPPEPRASHSIMRRAKSFHRNPDARSQEDLSPAAVRERRRMRGLSLGPLQLTTIDKGKEKQREPDAAAAPLAPKPLSRKSSFWSRKRNDSHVPPPSVTHLTVDRSPRPSLPSLQPISPFYMDTSIPLGPHDTASSPHLLANLQRRHSDRTHSSASLKSEYFEGMPPQEILLNAPTTPRPLRPRRPKRPQTADSASSPHFSSSFTEVPRVVTSSPPPMGRPARSEEYTVSQPPMPPASHTFRAPSRPRAQTNPPLLHRLSVNLFGSSQSTSTPHVVPNPLYDAMTGPDPVVSSPSSLGSSRPSLSKRSLEIPRPRSEEETPEVYLQRLMEAVSKAEVGTILALKPDPFHAQALRAYIARFNFNGDPLDVAVRKLLMDVGLPRETQQIDRVIEAFAARYLQCNPNLFTSDDHPYILAFSLIMLHTDAFNKSNKRKMTKPDYVKNTRLPGVSPEVLDCFYDNICFAPFIFIEDPLDVNGQRGLMPESITTRRMSTFTPSTPGGINGPASTLLGKGNKIDPYYLITHNMLDDLRVKVQSLVPSESPFMYQGTGGSWDEEELLRAFVMASIVEVNTAENRYLSQQWFGLGVTAGPGPMFQNSHGAVRAPDTAHGNVYTLKVTKIGLLLRKDDTLEGGRRAMNRKWRPWSMVLTGSQLLFFRDSTFATSFKAQVDSSSGHALVPHTAMPVPDEYLSVRDCIAVFDKSYAKHAHTFRLVMPDGHHYLLQAQEEREMNEWISRINYASAFKTAGVRMRALGMANRDIELTGEAAAASHLRDIQHRPTLASAPRVRTWYGGASNDVAGSSHDVAFPAGASPPSSPPAREASTTSGSDSTTSPIESSSKLFKATFDQVKSELASGRWQSRDDSSVWHNGHSRMRSFGSPPTSPTSPSTSVASDNSRGSSRAEIIRGKLRDLEGKMSLAQKQLDADMRFVRNLAVLTPFQRATRDRLQLAVQSAAKRIMQVRLDLEKLACYRDVLSDDLAADEQNWLRTKKIAMRAATDKLALQNPRAQSRAVPQMTLSLYLDDNEPNRAVVSSPRSMSRTADTSRSSRELESSFSESFYSALDESLDWHDCSQGSAALLDSGRLRESHSSESLMTSPLETHAESGHEYPFPDVSRRPHASPLAAQSSADSAASAPDISEGGTHKKFFTAHEMQEEQAEEWNKTRAAKRVSLVRLPPDLRISVLFGKQGHTGNDEGTATAPSSPKRANPYDRTDGAMEAITMLDI